MSHGYSILEMTKLYEKGSKKFGSMTKDIMTNNTTYYGILNIAKNFDLLFGLAPDNRKNAVVAEIYRGFPTTIEAAEKPIIIYFSQAINMFPEIKKIKFEKDDWPSPYNKNNRKET